MKIVTFQAHTVETLCQFNSTSLKNHKPINQSVCLDNKTLLDEHWEIRGYYGHYKPIIEIHAKNSNKNKSNTRMQHPMYQKYIGQLKVSISQLGRNELMVSITDYMDIPKFSPVK